jgi:hypothetical protein
MNRTRFPGSPSPPLRAGGSAPRPGLPETRPGSRQGDGGRRPMVPEAGCSQFIGRARRQEVVELLATALLALVYSGGVPRASSESKGLTGPGGPADLIEGVRAPVSKASPGVRAAPSKHESSCLTGANRQADMGSPPRTSRSRR